MEINLSFTVLSLKISGISKYIIFSVLIRTPCYCEWENMIWETNLLVLILKNILIRYLSIYLSIYLYVYLSMYTSVILYDKGKTDLVDESSEEYAYHVSIYLSLWCSSSIYIPVHLSGYLSVYLSIHLSIYLSIYLSF